VLAFRDEVDRHRCARRETGCEEVVRRRTLIGAAGIERLVGDDGARRTRSPWRRGRSFSGRLDGRRGRRSVRLHQYAPRLGRQNERLELGRRGGVATVAANANVTAERKEIALEPEEMTEPLSEAA